MTNVFKIEISRKLDGTGLTVNVEGSIKTPVELLHTIKVLKTELDNLFKAV